MKILYYNWIYYPHPLSGGRTLICRYYAKYMAKRGHTVAIYTSKYGKTPFHEYTEGYHIYRISPQITRNKIINLIKRPGALIVDRTWLKKAAKTFDILHIHGPTYGLPYINWRPWKIKEKPVFLTIHGLPKGRGLRNVLYDIENADTVIAVSEYIKKQLDAINIDKEIEVVHNGVDLEQFTPKEPPEKHSEPTIIYVSGAIEYKGFKDLLKALKILEKRKINIKTIMLGPGIKTVKHEEIHKYYSKADIFILPSHREGLPMSLLEAMAMKLAVIATKVGGIPYVVKNYENGILVEPKTPKQLADKIEQLAKDENLRKKLGENARKTVEKHYDIRKTVEKLEKIYLKHLN